LKRLFFGTLLASLGLSAIPAQAQLGITTRQDGDILIQVDNGVCARDGDLGTFFADNLGRVREGGDDAAVLAVACAMHMNNQTGRWRTSYYWVTRASERNALEAAVSQCNEYAAGQEADKGPVTTPCAVYGLAIRGGTDPEVLHRWSQGQ
jgi:hypothetical protein